MHVAVSRTLVPKRSHLVLNEPGLQVEMGLGKHEGVDAEREKFPLGVMTAGGEVSMTTALQVEEAPRKTGLVHMIVTDTSRF